MSDERDGERTSDGRTRAVPNADVVCTELDGNAVLLDLTTCSYFGLNETGLEIWRGMLDGLSLGEIGAALEQAYDIDLETAVGCVVDLADELASNELVTLEHAEDGTA